MTNEEICTLLEQGATISRDRNINLDFARIAEIAALRIRALSETIELANKIIEANEKTVKASEPIRFSEPNPEVFIAFKRSKRGGYLS